MSKKKKSKKPQNAPWKEEPIFAIDHLTVNDVLEYHINDALNYLYSQKKGK